MLQLRINTYPTKLSYEINNAQLKQQTTPPLMQIKTTPPTLEIRQPPGELSIDNKPFRESIGIKSFDILAREQAQLGRQAALEYIQKTAQQGNELARIYDKSVSIPEVITRFNQKGPLEITWAPIAKPEVRYQANPAEVEVIPGEVDLELQRGKVDPEYIPGSVDIKVTQYPKVEFRAVDIKV